MGFPETPERLQSLVRSFAGREGWELTEVVADPAVEAWVLRVHSSDYLERFRQVVERLGRGTFDTADNPMSPGTFRAALGAATAAVHAVERVLAGELQPTMAAVRPPGHHAERAHAMGFCFFNNIAIMAERALVDPRIRRVAIVDFDVHHGNGTQHIFEERADVAFWSLHQYPFYPGTGSEKERGRGVGFGYTRNVPLPAGCEDRAYLRAWESMVLPELEAYAPDLILVSAGFDAWRADPLGGMNLTEQTFSVLGSQLAGIAWRFCEGRMVSVLEGGYDVKALPRLVESFLVGCGKPT